MENLELINTINKQCKIVLAGNPAIVYSGKIISVGEGWLTLRDVKGELVRLNINLVSQVVERGGQ